MKKLLLLAGLLVLTSVSHAKEYPGAFVEGNAGLASPVSGLRFGKDWKNWSLSGGYQKREDDNVTLHTLNMEVDRNLLSFLGIQLYAGAGVGYTIPNTPSGTSENIDNGHSWLVRGGFNYKLNGHWGLGTSIQGFFFTNDSHSVKYEINKEKLSNGQEVETATPIHLNESRNFDAIFVALSVRYFF